MIKKALLAFVLFPLLLPHLFAQPKNRGYFNTTQISLLFGNRTEQIPYYTSPSYLSSSSIYYPSSYYPSSYYYEPYPYYYENRVQQVSPSVTMTHGYFFNEHWAAGIGVGFEIFDRNLFPLFADIRYTLWANKVSPFFTIKSGYSFSGFNKKQNDSYKRYGGLMVHPEVGVKIPLNENADLLLTVAYRYQHTKSTLKSSYTPYYYDEWIQKERLNRLSFGVAITFK